MNPVASPSTAFRQDIATVLTRLRSTFSRALAQYGSDGTLKSRDLQRRLGIDTRLSWQAARIVNAEDPIGISPHVPSPMLVNKLLEAARKNGAAPEAIAAARDSYAAFEDLIQQYADDRAGFDALMAPIVGGDTESQLELTHRRAIFDGHRYVWGVELETSAAARIVFPSAQYPGMFDWAQVRVKHNLRRLSTRSAIVVDVKKYFSPAAPPKSATPIDPEAFEKYGMAVIPAFCSQRDLPLRRRELASGGVLVEWETDTIGKPSSVSLAFGDVDRGGTLYPREGGLQGFNALVAIGTPTRLLVHDFLVHRATFGEVTCEVDRLGHLGYPLLEQRPEDESLPLPELVCRDRVTYLGSAQSALDIAEVPRYAELVSHVTDVCGLRLEDFDAYRMRAEYPLLDTMFGMRFTFPGSANWPKK